MEKGTASETTPSAINPPLTMQNNNHFGSIMEGGDSVLEAIYEDDNLEDVEMLDVEEGELMEQNSKIELGQSSGGYVNVVNQESRRRKRRRKVNKKTNKKKGCSGTSVTDINRFVVDICRRLKERKSYMVWTAVGCLGVSALSDLVKEVDAIQTCGGQMTADGRRFRTGGGILWSILKAREPKAYKEIMKRGKEFEKQFRQQNTRQAPEQNKEAASQRITDGFADRTTASGPDGSQDIPQTQNQLEQSNTEVKRIPVHNRIRVPVTYDDLLGEDPKDD